MGQTTYKLTARLQFPEGISPGEKSVSNLLVVARNGEGHPLLRGTSLAGALRSGLAALYETYPDDPAVSQWFGGASNEDELQPSAITINDAVFDTRQTIRRVHNQIDRHRGATAKGALFAIETLPPGCAATVSIVLTPDASLENQVDQFIGDLVDVLGSGFFLGGNSNRGIGRTEIESGVFVKKFELDELDGMADWMDTIYRERQHGVTLEGDAVTPGEQGNSVRIELDLGIPRGEDLLIGDGQEVDFALQPQRVMFSDGSEKWRIPGSSLRGVIRSWMTRLAAREGKPTCDSYMERKRRESTLSGDQHSSLTDDLGWGFVDQSERQLYQDNPDALDDYILDLFGSMYKRSRIHISDGYIDIGKGKAQQRMHVSIDGVSGGANEGALFSNQVLTSIESPFKVSITLKSPYDYELSWLQQTFLAIHRGILLVGSSKGSGRLEVKGLHVSPGYEDYFESLAQEIAA
jgi:CRISPR/Cas system CSM-associated protein Csm3 (group 7 of RAMP superfamily)